MFLPFQGGGEEGDGISKGGKTDGEGIFIKN
jgi:hypothetical protein